MSIDKEKIISLLRVWGDKIKYFLKQLWVFYRAKDKIWYEKIMHWSAFAFSIVIVYIIAVELNFLWLFGYTPNLSEINNPNQYVASEMYASNGKLLGKFFYENRTPVEYKELSPLLIKTLIATEDARFYQHSGIDFRALPPVIMDAIKGNPRGGSTLTQQLVKNLFKTRNRNHGLLGKIPFLKIFIVKSKEWIGAVKIELFFSKEDIITSYLNTVDFGSNAYGIKTAAKTYFNTTPMRLKPEQCAVLVGMLKAPTAYSPILNKERSTMRRNVVLGIMKRDNIITAKEYDTYTKKPIVLQYKVEKNVHGIANYFRRAVFEYLKPWLKENDLDLYADGLKIYTTLDYTMQVYAEEAVAQNMKRVQRQFDNHWRGQNPWIDKNKVEIPNFIESVVKNSWFYYKLDSRFKGNQDSIQYYLHKKEPMKLFSWNGPIDTVCSFVEATNYLKRLLHSGFVAMDPETGAVKAYVGGIDFNHFQHDNVKSMRQPGSTFKSIVYTTAIDKGMSPCDSIPDVPQVIKYMEKGEEKVWTPQNSDRKFVGGNVALKYAFAHSLNTISVQLTQKFGIETVIDYAHKLGIEAPLDTVPSVCLGSSDVTLLELTTSYCPFLNGGYRVTPMFVTRIEDKDGKILAEFKPEKEKILNEETVFLMQQMFLASLSEPYGTTQNLFSYDLFKYKTDFGGKTGTSSNYSDGWFIGVSPKLVAGTWVGAEERCVHFRSSHMGEGGKTALPTFGLFMEKVMRDTAYDYLRGMFPRHLKGLKNRPYSCYTKYVPRDTLDTLDIEEMELDSLEVPIIQDVSVSHKPEIKPSETQQIEAVENKRTRLFQRREQ